MKKIIITDAVDKKSAAILESAGFEVNYTPGLPKDELKKIIKDYNGLNCKKRNKSYFRCN